MEQIGRSTSSGGGLRSRGSTVDTAVGASVSFIERIFVPFIIIDSFGANCGTMRSGDADAV
jgi:hypothetical protein